MKAFLWVAVLLFSSSFSLPSSDQHNMVPRKRVFSSRSHQLKDDSDLDSVYTKLSALEYDIGNTEREMQTAPDQKTKDFLFRRLESKEDIAIAMRKSLARRLYAKEIEEVSRQERVTMLLAAKKIVKRYHRSNTSVEWIIEHETIPNIKNLKMGFVNRDEALSKLQEIHMSNLQRALMSSGEDWTVPLCDNIFGLGKSEFAHQYVKQCNIRMSQQQLSSELELSFKDSMSKAHTVIITFTLAEMKNSNAFEAVLIKKLQDFLIPKFKVAPMCLYAVYSNSAQFLSELIAESGPLFIALDEIGAAFRVTRMNDFERRELFLKFCEMVLSKWFLIPNLFFLLLGRGSFLNFVGSRSGLVDVMPPSPFNFERLSLQFLLPPAIVRILKETYRDEQTLFSYYQLDDARAEQVATRLYFQTTGHPRSLCRAFLKCSTLENLLSYSAPRRAIENYKEFYRYMLIYRKELEEMLGNFVAKNTVDLSQSVHSGGKSAPLEIVANNAFIPWEGTLEAARLQVSSATIEFVATYFSSLNTYLGLIQSSLELSLDFPDIFEVMLMKRFQALFEDAKCPAEELPEFFATAIFGSCQGLRVSGTARPMPRIRHKAQGRTLQDGNVGRNNWPFLLRDMDKHTFLCLKPPLRSASSGVLLCGYLHKARNLQRYTLGITAKNLDKSCAYMSHIASECSKFNFMFAKSDPMISRLNILILCATQYTVGLESQFRGQMFFTLPDLSAWRHIDEVIVLDLTSRTNRAKFFGLGPEDPLNDAIESVISKRSTVFEY